MSAAPEIRSLAPAVDEPAIAAAFARWAPGARRVGPWRWRFPLRDVQLAGGRVDATDGWLAFERPLPAAAAAQGGWDLLRAGERLPGPLRVALGLDGEPVVRADFAVGSTTDWSQVCHDAIALLAAAEALEATAAPSASPAQAGRPAPHEDLRDARRTQDAAVPAGSPADPALAGARAAAAHAATLVALCAEAGHLATARPSGLVVVDLEAAEAFRQAEIATDLSGARLAVEIAPPASRSAPCREALAELLLAASGAVRLARPWAEECHGEVRAGFEIRLPPAPDAVSLGHALSALAAVCQACAREAEALADETVAREYLPARVAHRGAGAARIHKSPG